MSTTRGERIPTPDDLLRMADGDRFELVHGRIMERQKGTESVGYASRIFGLISTFLLRHPLGYPLISGAGYACFADPNHLRRADSSFIRFGRLPGETLPDGDCPIPPDLAIEVVSPNDVAEEVTSKVADFQSVGVPLIWVVYPASRRVLVHRLRSSPHERISELTEADTITGEDVIPGFSCPVAEFFRIPAPQP